MRILAVHDLGLTRMHLQLAPREPFLHRLPNPFAFLPGPTLHENSVRVPLERHLGEPPFYPGIERHGQGIPVASIQSRARHRRFARAIAAQWPLPGCPTSWPDAKIVLHRPGLGHGSDAAGPPPARTPRSVAA